MKKNIFLIANILGCIGGFLVIVLIDNKDSLFWTLCAASAANFVIFLAIEHSCAEDDFFLPNLICFGLAIAIIAGHYFFMGTEYGEMFRGITVGLLIVTGINSIILGFDKINFLMEKSWR